MSILEEQYFDERNPVQQPWRHLKTTPTPTVTPEGTPGDDDECVAEGEKPLPPPVESCEQEPPRSCGWWNHFKDRQAADRKKIAEALHAINDKNTHERHRKQIWKLQQLLTQANGVIACRVLDLEEKQELIESQEETIETLHGDADAARESIRILNGRVHNLHDRISSLKEELKEAQELSSNYRRLYLKLKFEPLYTSIWRWLRRVCWR